MQKTRWGGGSNISATITMKLCCAALLILAFSVSHCLCFSISQPVHHQKHNCDSSNASNSQQRTVIVHSHCAQSAMHAHHAASVFNSYNHKMWKPAHSLDKPLNNICRACKM